jgi:hypothetical protein
MNDSNINFGSTFWKGGIHIKENKEPPLKKPTFLVDGKLDDKLDTYEITKLMNKSNFSLFCSKAGGGKTTMIVSLLNTPNLFKKVYHTIYLFMGKNSRDSIKGSFFDKNIPEEQIYDELSIENLNDVYEKVKEDAKEGYKSLIIGDDIQKQLKDKDVEKQLLHMVNNRRHLGLSLWFANQNYFSLPKQVRFGLTDIFLFNVSKKELENINEEQLELPKEVFNDVTKLCFKKDHDFMYVNSNSGRIFCNWNEIILPD